MHHCKYAQLDTFFMQKLTAAIYKNKLMDNTLNSLCSHEAYMQVIMANHETELIKQKMLTLETKLESQATQLEFLQMLVRKYMNT